MTGYKPRMRNGKLSPTAKITQRLLDGEVIGTKDPAMVRGFSGQIKRLESHGYKFKKEKSGREVFYSLDKRSVKGKGQTKRTKKQPEAQPVSLPSLGATVEVTLLATNTDGSYSVGIRNGERTWVLKLQSQT